ncbi:hypothetical protein N8T08_003287 [Aspergillus melleus]|uniref:Uncharacterized protein n=1 Tax=Aspergillus melleus TaxID=138277 RepID=A0ACC3B6Q6_9EURO|nr:hypothetical protein N8T08_003287 [Aspergillus melleus]
MGNPPTRIIIARHGARLDAADKNWHLTSPTPYDPPLSYGGWLQSRTLGAQIINLLESQNNEELSEETGDRNLPSLRAQPSKRKRRIIVHSSPYLRCLQTAIAVSAGISQHFPETDAALPPKPSAIPNPKTHTTGKGRASVHGFNAASAFPSPIPNDHRCLLRVDAFLGEWLTSSYFEEISPPPKSERMITAAKAELLRRDSIVPDADINYTKPAVGHFPGGWGKGDGFPSSEDSSRTQTNPDGRRNRAASHDTLQSADTLGTRRMLSKINTSLSSIPDGLYTPPTPSYAISPSEPIPTGYVSHARDACVRIDYQWDSMREPQGWGNGGEYEEEWSTMNSRFGVGLERMVSWYSNHDPSIPYNRPRRHSQFLDNTGDTSSGDGEDLVETVLVIVTHGAGCNALISAIKGETTLVNVGTASLTMAVLKDSDKTSTKSSDLGGPVVPHYANGEKSVLHDYTLQLVASTEHLRPGGNPAMSSVSSPTSLTSPTVPSYRNRVTSRASLSQSPFGIGPTPTSGGGSRVWMMARPSTAPRTSGGLWGSMSAKGGTDDLIPNFDNAWSGQAAEKESDVKKSTDSEPPKQLPQRTLSQRGLWGSAPLNKDAETGVKRRWTVTERRI